MEADGRWNFRKKSQDVDDGRHVGVFGIAGKALEISCARSPGHLQDLPDPLDLPG